MIKNKTYGSIKYLGILCTILWTSSGLYAQDLKVTAEKDSRSGTDAFSQIQVRDYDPLSPSKAAFYSAVFPGLGQIYNKKYWKAPIVWGAMGTSIYFYVTNSREYDRYRKAFKLRKLGKQDEFTDDNGNTLISDAGLEHAQETLKRNTDLSLLITVGIYVLQIIEASTNAHLMQFNMDSNISFTPTVNFEHVTGQAVAGMSFTYKFN